MPGFKSKLPSFHLHRNAHEGYNQGDMSAQIHIAMPLISRKRTLHQRQWGRYSRRSIGKSEAHFQRFGVRLATQTLPSVTIAGHTGVEARKAASRFLSIFEDTQQYRSTCACDVHTRRTSVRPGAPGICKLVSSTKRRIRVERPPTTESKPNLVP